ncbi:MAG: PatB family C-S lyase, partial [Bacteroidota bacterium]
MFEESYFDHHIERTGTGCVKYDLRSNFFERDDILPMWVADMDFRTPPFIIEKIRERLDHEVLAYTFRTPSFGKAVKRWMETRHHWNIEENWVTYSPGVVPALNMCVLAYTQPGDKIIVQPPVYFPFFSAIKDHDRIMVENPLVLRDGAYRMDLDHLRSVIDDSVKMIFLCSPHNPVGRVWTKEELIGLSEICLDHNIIIISDEIHHDLIFEGYSHFPTAKISKYISEMTVTCIAPSKTFNLAGMSTSALIIENDHLRSLYDAVLNKFHLNLGNIFGNVALEAAYNYGDEWITGLMKYIKGN